jgi:hypothetical protein
MIETEDVTVCQILILRGDSDECSFIGVRKMTFASQGVTLGRVMIDRVRAAMALVNAVEHSGAHWVSEDEIVPISLWQVWKLEALACPRKLTEPLSAEIHKWLRAFEFPEPYRMDGVHSFGEKRAFRRTVGRSAERESGARMRYRRRYWA